MSDELPPLEILGEEPASTVEEVRSDPTRSRWPWLVVLAVVLAVLVASLTGSEGDGDASPTTSTTASTTTTTTTTTTSTDGREPATEGRFLRTTPTPLLGQPVGAVLLLIGDDGWRLVDLDTGFVAPLDETIPGAGRSGPPGQAMAAALPGRLLVLDHTTDEVSVYDVQRAVDDRTRLVRVRDFELDVVEGAEPAALYVAGDHFWLVMQGSDERPGLLVRRTDRDGNAVGPPVGVRSFPQAATREGVVVGSGGRMFLVGETGARDLGVGIVRGAGPDHVVAATCDAETVCVERVLAATTGAVVVERSVPFAQAGDAGRSQVAVSRDGALASLSFASGSDGLTISRPDGRSTGLPLADANGAPAWLPGAGVLVIANGGVVHSAGVGDGFVGSRIEGLPAAGAFSLVVVPL